jgi:hypothetical protein
MAGGLQEETAMSDYIMGEIEIRALALALTDAGQVLNRPAKEWASPRIFDCENCGELSAGDVRQATRDETCLEVCRRCGAIARERLPF